ncbi:MAG: hypothetical protein R3335_04560 [Anaerolineales bacterium]|nr:hypothetical protein [Anaerolineales bacterium]
MSFDLTVRARALGRKRSLVPDISIPVPTDWQIGGRAMNLRELITLVVAHELRAFEARQEENHFVRVLTERQLERGRAAGVITHGDRDFDQPVSTDEAVAVSLQAFQDGLYYVFIDEVQYLDLEQAVYINEESTLTFIRLVALTGG